MNIKLLVVAINKAIEADIKTKAFNIYFILLAYYYIVKKFEPYKLDKLNKLEKI